MALLSPYRSSLSVADLGEDAGLRPAQCCTDPDVIISMQAFSNRLAACLREGEPGGMVDALA